jgi:hypothetical protein
MGRIAILYSHPSELWDRLAPGDDIDRPRRYLSERRVLYHVLRGLHRQVDMIQDEVLPAEQGIDVNDYKVIFMSQRCITAKGADMLLDWVRGGGTLVGVVSIGQFDELERPWQRMLDAFGLKSLRVRFDSPSDGPRRVTEHDLTLRNEQSMWSEIEVGDAVVTAHFEDGAPAVTEQSLDKGRLIYAAFEPGNAYHRFNEVHAPLKKELRLLLGMQEAPRELLEKWIEPAGEPVCEADDPLISARLIRAEHADAVFLINTTGQESVAEVRVTVRGRKARRAVSLEQGKLRLVVEGDVATFTSPLGLTDVVRLD